jgi:hypothetical protein
MLNLDLESFMVAFEDGSVKNVGPTNKAATAKLFHPETVEAREFGDSQVKIVAEDDDGNEVQIAMFPEQLEEIEADVESIREDGRVFE